MLTTYIIIVAVMTLVFLVLAWLFGGFKAAATYFILVVFQNVISIPISPEYVSQIGNICFNINIGMVAALYMLFFAKEKLKIGSAMFLGLSFVLIIFSAILISIG